MITLIDCMILATLLVSPFFMFLYMTFINLFDIVADWFKGGGGDDRHQ